MKILALEVATEFGRRTVQISPPVDVEPFGDMPPQFQTLTQKFWEIICAIAANSSELAARAPKAEA
jgi:hypothetical protein